MEVKRPVPQALSSCAVVEVPSFAGVSVRSKGFLRWPGQMHRQAKAPLKVCSGRWQSRMAPNPGGPLQGFGAALPCGWAGMPWIAKAGKAL